MLIERKKLEVLKMAPSNNISLPDFDNFLDITLKERLKDFELDDMDKERLLSEWKKSMSYYSSNPEDFYFKFSDL